ncbi:MAG TPA: hypothetical protein HPQ04_07255 [Rhodospirillaceae bacterium]|nr:hypothetical protein [Rhodospirillaceae bacterium]
MTEQPQAETPPPAPAAKSSGNAFLAGLAGGVLVTAGILAAAAVAWPTLSARLLGDMDRRLSLVERATDDVHARMAAIEQAESRNANGTLLQNLTQRLAAVESQATPGAGAGADTRLAAEISRLNAELEAVKRSLPPEGAILRLADKAEQAQREARQLSERNRSSQALLLVVGQLRDAVNRGDSYEIELRAARRLAAAEDSADLDALAAFAANGIPRRDVLLALVPTLAADCLRASVAPPEGDLWQRSLNQLAGLFRLRRIDGKGSDAQAVVARAESQAKDGDLAKTASEISALDGEAGRLAAPWLANAKARVAADKALSQLSAAAAAESARVGG